MISKGKIKNSFYIDRDTDTEKLVNEIFAKTKAEMKEVFDEEKNILMSKEAGDYRTVDFTVKVGNTELDKLIVFYKGAVVPYFYRQEYSDLNEKVESDNLKDADKQIKRMVGFVERGADGVKTNVPNSITNFRLVKEFLEFLENVENVCFVDNDYKFPDAKEYKKALKEKGRAGARNWALEILKTYLQNKYPDGEVT